MLHQAGRSCSVKKAAFRVAFHILNWFDTAMFDSQGFISARVTDKYGVKVCGLGVIYCGNSNFCFAQKVGNTGKDRWQEIAETAVYICGFVLYET